MKTRHAQSGITLVVSLIMLIVLTLLVVSAIRFGNINLKISGNAQTEAEATAAIQVAIEQTMVLVAAAEKIDTVPAQPNLVVSTGGFSYKVNVAKPVCILSKNIPNSSLDRNNVLDRPCISAVPQTPRILNGMIIAPPTACKDQQWDIAADLVPDTTGAKINMLQGVALRVPVEVQCP